MLVCPNCGNIANHRDYVMRIVKYGGCNTEWVQIERSICPVCNAVRRILPDYLLPYKHYTKDVIAGFVSGRLTVEDASLIFEDYPCDMTIVRWQRSQKLQGLV